MAPTSAEFQAVKRYGHTKYERSHRREWCGGNARTAELVQRHRRAVRRWEREICVEAQAPTPADDQPDATFVAEWAVAKAAVGEGGLFAEKVEGYDQYLDAAEVWAVCCYRRMRSPTNPSAISAERRARRAMFAAKCAVERGWWGPEDSDTQYECYHLTQQVKLFKKQLAGVMHFCVPAALPAKRAVVIGPQNQYTSPELHGFGRQLFFVLTGEEYDEQETPRHHPALVWLAENYPDMFKDGRGWGYTPPVRVCPVPGGVYRIEDYDGKESLVLPDRQEWTVIE